MSVRGIGEHRDFGDQESSLREAGLIGSKRTFEDLTTEQQAQLTALLDELGSFPIPETIVRCMEAVGVDPRIKDDQTRADAAMAGAWAFDRTLLYLDRLHLLNEERMQTGEEIQRFMQVPYPRSEAEVKEAARARIMAPHFAGKQEVVLNFFCVSIQHIRSLLKVASTAVGYEIPSHDLDYLDEFRYLRNHYEHWYERLPGNTNEVGLVTKTLTDDEYRVTGGLQTDEHDRFIVIEPKKTGPVTHIVDVTDNGLKRVEKIVRETSEKIKELAIEHVRAHFTANPEHIPSPTQVRQDFLLGVGSSDPKMRQPPLGPPHHTG